MSWGIYVLHICVNTQRGVNAGYQNLMVTFSLQLTLPAIDGGGTKLQGISVRKLYGMQDLANQSFETSRSQGLGGMGASNVPQNER